MNLKIDETGKSGTLYLSGKLTVENISEIKKALDGALTLVNSLKIDHSEAEELDLTYLQLLYSCFKTAGEMQKQFSVSSSGRFLEIIETAGFPEPEFFSYNEL